MLAAAGRQVSVRLEAVDSNGLLPLRAAPQVSPTAYHFRRVLQKLLPPLLFEMPEDDPLAEELPSRLAVLPGEITRRWPAALLEELRHGSLAELPTIQCYRCRKSPAGRRPRLPPSTASSSAIWPLTNSASGIFWCLGRYDRPWAPERPIFGVVRYMSSESTRKKMRVDAYVRRYAPGGARQLRLV